MTGPEQPRSPWADGDKWEEELGAEAVKQLRANRQQRALMRERNRNIRKGMLETLDENDPERKAQLIIEVERQMFRRNIEIHKGAVEEVFSVDENTGQILVSAKEYLMTEPRKPRFLRCVSPAGRQEGIVRFAPDDVRKAAQWFMNQYPETSFTFEEDRGHGTFSYKATVREKGE